MKEFQDVDLLERIKDPKAVLSAAALTQVADLRLSKKYSPAKISTIKAHIFFHLYLIFYFFSIPLIEYIDNGWPAGDDGGAKAAYRSIDNQAQLVHWRSGWRREVCC